MPLRLVGQSEEAEAVPQVRRLAHQGSSPMSGWTHCRYEGCRRNLKDKDQVIGFCSGTCHDNWKEEKDRNIENAVKAFEKQDH